MLYVASRQPLYVLVGLIAGSGASVVAYKLFNHVRVRVLVWKDPFTVYNEGGYQVAQSLMAIGTGSWFGMGLFQGAADQIPVAESDFIFRQLRRNGTDFCTWSDPGMCQCLYDVSEYCDAASGQLL